MFVLIFIIAVASFVIIRSIWMLARGDKAWYFGRKGIYGEIPISIAIILFAISTFASSQETATVLRFSSFGLGIGGFLINLLKPSFLKPVWLRWLEQEYSDILHLLKQDAREKGFHVWAEQVKTQAGLETWAHEVRQKYQNVPISPPPNRKAVWAVYIGFILLFATAVILFPSNRPNPDIYIPEAFMCEGFDGEKQPLGQRTNFPADAEEIYLCAYFDSDSPVLRWSKDKALTFTINWTGPDIYKYDYVRTEPGWFYVALVNDKDNFSVGKYHVDIGAGKAKQKTVEFEVIATQ